MNKSKTIIAASIALVLVTAVSLMGFTSLGSSLVPGSVVLAAGPNNNGNGDGGNPPPPPPNPHGKVKPSERQAAANKRLATLAAAGLTPTIQAVTAGQQPDYFGFSPNYANSELPTVDPQTLAVTGGIKKFVDALPGVGAIPVAVSQPSPAGTVGPTSDYYEIAAVQYQAKMSSSLTTNTTLRGYVQIENSGFVGTTAHIQLFYPGGDPILKNGAPVYAVAAPAYLGPIIVAQTGKPVRILFDNYLPPTADPGYLFVPVDTSYMGAGSSFNGGTGGPSNKAVVHLHGGVTPWISDGTPHQEITPGNETTGFKAGPSVQNVPDMPIPPNGSVTLYYTNAQSARLMFYHDHAEGLTRLNVYDGMAAGYVLQDTYEATMVNGGTITPPGGTPVNVAAGTIPDMVGIPLVIQDKTFVPNPTQLAAEDPTWDTVHWGGPGSLWFPHVYMPNQNPYDASGANPMGRWDYGPWFWPPFTGLLNGPIPNAWASLGPWEPPIAPGVPFVSGTPEAFMDTPVVNGMAYPTLTVPAAPVRFRILSVGNDRAFNLQLYQATSPTNGIINGITIDVGGGGSGYSAPPLVTITNAAGDTTGRGASAIATVNATGSVDSIQMITVGSSYTAVPTVTIAPPSVGVQATATAHLYTDPTEVGMVPASLTAGIAWPAAWMAQTAPYTPDILDGRQGGVPDPAYRGPAWVQIGTEGGFLPAPALIPNTPVGYEQNKRNIVVLNVKEHSLFLGPAERADVIVDFTNFAGKTLILYNDSPAPVPAGDPRYDYFTGDLDQTSSGGAPTTQPGYGPNTRTIMQIVVSGSGGSAPVDDYNTANFAALQTALPAAFAASQPEVIVPQTVYQSAYPATTMPASTDATQFVKIADTSFTFTPIGQASPVTFNPMEPKTIQELFTVDYGRMNATLGVEIPFTNGTNQTTIPYGYIDPLTELIQGSDTATPIGALGDGTQIWKITHNGVDTHVIHVHLFNAQIVNRVGWDGQIYPPEPNEIGWKESIRMNPLSDTILALRPINMTLPWDLPNSIRLMDPTRLAGATGVQFFNVDPSGNPVTVTNDYVNFGWEYVWHCHILGHEENDMMRGIAYGQSVIAPSNLIANLTGSGTKTTVILTWTDNSRNETNFVVQRGTAATGPWTTIATLPADTKTYTDPIGNTKTTYYYQVYAVDNIGATKASGFTAPVAGYSLLTLTSGFAGPSLAKVYPPSAPTNVAATAALRNTTSERVTVIWTGSAGATGYNVQISTSSTFTPSTTIVASGTVNGNTFSFTSGNLPRVAYYVRINATNSAGTSAWANATPFPVPAQ